MRGHGNELNRRYDFSFASSFVFTLQKNKRLKARPNKTFIIPGELFNVFDIKRPRGGRDENRETETERGGGVEGGERWGSDGARRGRGQEIRGEGVRVQ